jgi:hypothetical protein
MLSARPGAPVPVIRVNEKWRGEADYVVAAQCLPHDRVPRGHGGFPRRRRQRPVVIGNGSSRVKIRRKSGPLRAPCGRHLSPISLRNAPLYATTLGREPGRRVDGLVRRLRITGKAEGPPHTGAASGTGIGCFSGTRAQYSDATAGLTILA